MSTRVDSVFDISVDLDRAIASLAACELRRDIIHLNDLPRIAVLAGTN